ncbi:MAG TPA: error-prone DNA polymerase, partial [Steroidobacteraceae bacterium]|nr:error-prone DNA polymerase [Steroidobacteraceae bacterium]
AAAQEQRDAGEADAGQEGDSVPLPLHLLIGAEFKLDCGLRFVALAIDRLGYGRLCRLITRGRRSAAKGGYHLTRADLEELGLEQCFILWLPAAQPDPTQVVWLAERFPRVRIAVELLCGGADREHLATLQRIAREGTARGFDLRLVASGDVHMHTRARRRLQDTVTAIRLGVPLAEAGWHLYPNGERYLREPVRLARLYPAELLAETVAIAQACHFSLDELRYEYPRELVPLGHTPTSYLRHLTEEGARRHWPDGVPEKERIEIDKELALIAELGYEAFFLTVEDIVRFARKKGILCQGRGSAANSRVCYCLGVSAVDPTRGAALLFARFISKERNEPPDIDIDFEHERREEVIQYVYDKYGRQRAALAATVIMYRPRSALRDLGKAFGLGVEASGQLAKVMQWWDGGETMPERLREAGIDPDEPVLARLLPLAREIVRFPGFPRHLSQHVGGFVISEGPLEELVPIENAAMPERTVVQWDKDDLNDLGLLKVDVLALGMLTALKRAFDLVNAFRGESYTLGKLPAEDPEVYEMISRADTIGVFQIESRAQMAMLPRLRPQEYYDLVIEVAIVRPGPIQGDMVHPYLRRRNKQEPVDYPSDDVREVLKRTLGVPIFQEQVMQIAVVAAGFTPGESDALRRAMGAWKRTGGLDHFKDKLLGGMRARGYSDDFAQRIYNQMLGFGEYGFPECVVGGTRVVDADTGRWVTVDDVVSGRTRLENTLACNDDLRLCRRRVEAVRFSGEKLVWRLRTALGHEIVATAEHPFMTLGGWRKLGELRVGDFVAAARSLPVSGRRHWPRHQILVLADLIAEGNLCHLPPEVFELRDSDIALLLARLWEGDGGFSAKGHASYDTASQRLGREVQHLLLRLGIVARCYRRVRSYKGRELEHNVVTVTGEEGLRLFWRHVGRRFLDPKKRRLSRLLAAHRNGRMSRDIIPAEVRAIIRRERDAAGLTWKEIGRRSGLGMREIQARSGSKGGFRRFVIDRLAAVLDSSELACLARSDLYWDRIVSIETAGQQATYDLQIEGHHNFLANNLVVHNSHAASFALLVYDSAWLKCFEPAAFACALLNSQPMGFYAPAQLVRDARAHGVEVRPVDVCVSAWDCTLERREDGEPVLRLGMRLVKSLSEAGAARLVSAREQRPFASVQDLAERAVLDRGDLEALAAAGAFAALSGNRHLAFWEVAGTERVAPVVLPGGPARLELGARTGHFAEGQPLLPAPTEGERIVADYASIGLTLGRHPLALLRERLRRKQLLSAAELRCVAHGRTVRTAGIVLMRQRPQTARGITFLTLEDESGQVNVIVWERIGREQRRPLLESRLLEVHGEWQRQEEVMHLIAHRLVDRTKLLGELLTRSRDFH